MSLRMHLWGTGGIFSFEWKWFVTLWTLTRLGARTGGLKSDQIDMRVIVGPTRYDLIITPLTTLSCEVTLCEIILRHLTVSGHTVSCVTEWPTALGNL